MSKLIENSSCAPRDNTSESEPQTSNKDGMNGHPLESYHLICALITGLIVFCENFTLVFVTFTSPKLKSTKYFLVASLCVTDLLVGVILTVGSIFHLATGKETIGLTVWSIGVYTVYYLVLAMNMVSVIHMAIMAAERYIYISHPFFYERNVTIRIVKWVTFLSWIIAFPCLATPIIIDMIKNGRQLNDTFYLGMSRFVLYILSTLYFCLLIFSFTCYSLILVQVCKHKRRLVELGASHSSLASAKRNNNTDFLKCFKFFLTVFGIFFLMTFPMFLVSFLSRHIDIPQHLEDITFYLKTLNCGTNLLVMIVIDAHFRKSLHEKTCALYKFFKL